MPILAIQAHNGDINGVAIGTNGKSDFAASCGRDRTIQIFRKSHTHLDLLQTLDDHTASVTDLLFSATTCDLVSISSDRTVLIRRLVCDDQGSQAFVSIRTIVLKASPISITCVPDEPGLLVISTMDRQIQKYDMFSGRLLHSFKTADPGSSETLIMSSIVVHIQDDGAKSIRLVIGTSSTDKSIRIYDYETGSLFIKEYGQTAVSAVGLITGSGSGDHRRQRLVSCGLDRTIMMWDLISSTCPGLDTSSTATSEVPCSPTNQTPTSARPRRHILSKTQISTLQKSLKTYDDTAAPIQSTSPSRVRRKTSRVSLTANPKISLSHQRILGEASSLSLNEKHACRSSQHFSSRSSSPQSTRTPKSESPSSNTRRRRTKSAANLDDLEDSARRLCDSLRSFRKRFIPGTVGKLDGGVMQELDFELKLTTNVLSEKVAKRELGGELTAGGPLDTYLANLIDERLALKAKSNERKDDDQKEARLPEEDQYMATVGAKDSMSHGH